MSIRGTETAIYSYAHYNEVILNNRSVIILPSNYRFHTHFATGKTFDQGIDNKFRKRFQVYEYEVNKQNDESTQNNLENILIKAGCDLFYVLKSGEKDHVFSNKIPTAIHCVFTLSEPHGNVYIPLSKSVYLKSNKQTEESIRKIKYSILPHICESLPQVKDNMRLELGIPSQAKVFGSMGGYESFDLDFVQRAIIELAINSQRSLWFIFLGIKPFCDNIPNIIFLPPTNSLIYKSRFIFTCDAMIHARSIGESFGMSIAEFTSFCKPIITYNPLNKTDIMDTHHIDILGDTGVYYQGYYSFLDIIFQEKYIDKKPVDFTKVYHPRKVMKTFDRLVIQPCLADRKYKLQVICNWDQTENVHNKWSKMLNNKHSITFSSQNPDYYLVVNAPKKEDYYDPSKTIVIGMEPDTFTGSRWNWYGDKRKYMYFLDHNLVNGIEWWLNKSFDQLWIDKPIKTKSLSCIVSSQYVYEGHKLRINLLKKLEKEIPSIDIYGWSNDHCFSNYKGSLMNGKDEGLYPYKYTIAIENTQRSNYFTEKIVDSLLSETLCFYWGCPNISDYFIDKSYILLPFEAGFDECIKIIKESIINDEWTKRIDHIREIKHRILCSYNIPSRISGLLQYHRMKKYTINLDSRPDKYKIHLNRCSELGLPYPKRLRAVQGSRLSLDKINKYFRLTYNFIGNGKNTGAIIGCAMSHYKLWKKSIKNNQPILCMEDDISFSSDFVDRISFIMRTLEYIENWDILFLGYHINEKNYDTHNLSYDHLQKMFNRQDIIPFEHCLSYGTVMDACGLHGGGTFGYIISSRGAKKLVDMVSVNKFYYPVDYQILEAGLSYGLRILMCAHPIITSPKFGFDTNDSDVQK